MLGYTPPKGRPTPPAHPWGEPVMQRRSYSPTEAEKALHDLFYGHRHERTGVLPRREHHWPWEAERMAEGRKAAAAHNAEWTDRRAERMFRRAERARARAHARVG